MSSNPMSGIRDAVRVMEPVFAMAKEKKEVAAALSMVWNAAEDVLASSSSPDVAVACGPGCPECCRVNVAVLAPEAVAIATFLEADPEVGGHGFPEKLADFAARVRWVDHAERLRCHMPCPFLDIKSSCMIHPVRPLMCRSITSTDPEACRRALEAAAWDEDEPLEMDILRKLVLEEAYMALADLLAKLGLDAKSVELTRGVAAVVQRPEIVQEFVGGNRIDWG